MVSDGKHLTPKAQEVLKILREGNRRFQKEQPETRVTAERRKQLLKGQAPIATVLTCSDSRVGPNYIFDQDLGMLFIIRSAGEVFDDMIIASLEYGVEHLKTPLLIILAHTHCGAINASVSKAELHGHLPQLVEKIKAAINACEQIPHDCDEDLELDITIEHALEIMEELPNISEPINEAVESGITNIIVAIYEMGSGEVKFYDGVQSHKAGNVKKSHHL